MSREKTYKEIKAMFGIVPTMFKVIPDDKLAAEWQLFKKVQFDEGPIPNKYRELIGLAVSALAKCKYYIFFHTEIAKLNGATQAEIEDAIHFAKSTVGWSTYVTGLQLDFNQFKKETKQCCAFAKKQQTKKPKSLSRKK